MVLIGVAKEIMFPAARIFGVSTRELPILIGTSAATPRPPLSGIR